MNNPQYIWEPETGYAACILTDNQGKVYFGAAQCSDVDKDMMSEKTGCMIAEKRALIKALKDCRKELKIKQSALNQLYYSVNKSKKYNSRGYMERMLKRQMKMIETDIETYNQQISAQQKNLNTFINDKDEFYKRIRQNRKGDNH